MREGGRIRASEFLLLQQVCVSGAPGCECYHASHSEEETAEGVLPEHCPVQGGSHEARSQGHRTTGSQGHRATGSQDHRVTGSQGTGSQDHSQGHSGNITDDSVDRQFFSYFEIIPSLRMQRSPLQLTGLPVCLSVSLYLFLSLYNLLQLITLILSTLSSALLSFFISLSLPFILSLSSNLISLIFLLFPLLSLLSHFSHFCE